MTIKEKALTWWGEQIENENYVISASEIDRREREYLQKKGYLYLLVRGLYFIKRPEDDGEEIFPLLYWKIIEKLISAYSWSIRGKSALQVLNGEQTPQEQLFVRTKEKTNKKITLPLNFSIALQYDATFDDRLIKKMDVGGRKIPVDVPERVIIDVSNEKSKDVLSFVAGTKFDARVLDAIYAKKPRPVVYKRMIGLANEVKRTDLAARLEKTIEDHTEYQFLTKTDKERARWPTKPVVISPPWIIRQEEQTKEFEDALTSHLKQKIARIKKQPLSRLLKLARAHKKYDTYHSTSLEGYRITAEEVEALFSGRVPEGAEIEGPEYFEKLKNRMAIVGYGEAFDYVLEKAAADFKKPSVTEELIKDTYYNLFKPSAEADLVDYHSLTTYRNIPVFIRGTRYAPPSCEKLPELMASYEKIVNAIENPVVKAFLAHYLFVTIHPYSDGNGRTARLLMNYLLLSEGYSWATVRTEERFKYFDALSAGQLGGDILPFGEFILEILKGASKIDQQNSG